LKTRSKSIQSSSVSTAHLLLCILKRERSTTKLLNKLKIDYDVAKEQYINMTPNEEEFLENLPKAADYNDDSGQDDSLKEVILIIPTNLIKSKTPVLDNFGRDLTEMAEEGKLDPVGREKEIERVCQILSRRKRTTLSLLVNLGWKISYCGGLLCESYKRKCQESCLTSALLL
jgi:ATP-dependent Clp protease ATP-binding subunit ClpC